MQHLNSNSNTDLIASNKITRYFRIGRVATHTLAGIIIASSILPLASYSLKRRIIKWWSTHLLAAFNIRVISHGHIPQVKDQLKTTMFVANHISWTDVHALNSLIALRFVAKSEIRSWPVIGYLTYKANALFIDRAKRQDAGRIVNTAAHSLQSGDNLCFFPEGTTTDGTEIKRFKSSLIQAAIEANATIRPVAIRYPTPSGNANIGLAYAGETTMLQSMLQILSQKNPVVELFFLAPIIITELAEQDKDRRALTHSVEYSIRHTLDLHA